MTDVIRNREEVPVEEERNWPKGARKSTHEFMDLERSPIVNRRYFDNEQIFYLYGMRRNELIFREKLNPWEAEIKAKIEVLDIIYPKVDLINFVRDNITMPDKCCRLIFTSPLHRIASSHIVHGEALKFFNATLSEDLEDETPSDPKWGFDLTKPEEGFPCINLSKDGCAYHHTGDKPFNCNKFPIRPDHLRQIATCSYSFKEVERNRWERSGTCNRCMG